MILCTISQFSSLQQHLGSQVISQYQISPEEFDFLQTIHEYENRQNDNELAYIIDRYERLFDSINVTRLVALKLVGYHHQVPPLRIDATLLESYQALVNQQAAVANMANTATLPNPSLQHSQITQPEQISGLNPTTSMSSPTNPILTDTALNTPSNNTAVKDMPITPIELDPIIQVAAGRFG